MDRQLVKTTQYGPARDACVGPHTGLQRSSWHTMERTEAATEVPDILRDDSDVSLPGSQPEPVLPVDRFQDVNTGFLATSRRINKKSRAKDKNLMARACDVLARAAALEAGDLHPRPLAALSELQQAPLLKGARLSCKEAVFVKVGEYCENKGKTFVCNNGSTNTSKNVDRAVVCKCHDKKCAFLVKAMWCQGGAARQDEEDTESDDIADGEVESLEAHWVVTEVCDHTCCTPDKHTHHKSKPR